METSNIVGITLMFFLPQLLNAKHIDVDRHSESIQAFKAADNIMCSTHLE